MNKILKVLAAIDFSLGSAEIIFALFACKLTQSLVILILLILTNMGLTLIIVELQLMINQK